MLRQELITKDKTWKEWSDGPFTSCEKTAVGVFSGNFYNALSEVLQAAGRGEDLLDHAISRFKEFIMLSGNYTDLQAHYGPSFLFWGHQPTPKSWHGALSLVLHAWT